jgi:antitoxin ParD1/3/4
MNVTLTPQLERLINQKVEAGLYQSSEEVIAKALELLDEYDKKLADLREGIRIGIEQADRGQLTPASEVFERLERRNAQRTK